MKQNEGAERNTALLTWIFSFLLFLCVLLKRGTQNDTDEKEGGKEQKKKDVENETEREPRKLKHCEAKKSKPK